MRGIRSRHRYDTGFGEQFRQARLSPRWRRRIAQLKNAARENREAIENAAYRTLGAFEAWARGAFAS